MDSTPFNEGNWPIPGADYGLAWDATHQTLFRVWYDFDERTMDSQQNKPPAAKSPRFGVQTILWGHRPNFERLFQVIRDGGYEGVELFQHPLDLPKPEELREMLSDTPALELIGLSGGSLQQRMDYLKDWPRDKDGWMIPYLYVDSDTEEEIDRALKGKFRLAIHPHHLKPIEADRQAERYLKKPGVFYIADTAHADIARDNFLHILKVRFPKLASLHLKDWRPGFGRASPMYSRGFTELGTGEVQLDEALRVLIDEYSYKGWIVVEQDYSEALTEASHYSNVKWLAERGRLNPDLKLAAMRQALPNRNRSGETRWEQIREFRTRSLFSKSIGQLYDRTADALCETLKVKGVAIWSCSEIDKVMTLESLCPRPEGEDPTLTIAFETLESPPQVEWTAPRDKETLPSDLRSLRKNNARTRLLVKSTWNPNHIHSVVDLYGDDVKEFCDDRNLGSMLCQAIIRSFESHLEKISFSWASELNSRAGATKDAASFSRELQKIIQKALNCDSVGLFLADPNGVRLRPFPQKDPKYIWSRPQRQYYEKGDGQQTTEIWQSKKPRFRDRGPHSNPSHNWLCVLKREKYPNADKVLAMPIVDVEGESLGLIRCVNKMTRAGNLCNFCDDDLIVLDRLIQWAIPALRLRRNAEDEKMRLLLLSHEFRNPVAALISSAAALSKSVKPEKTRAILAHHIRIKNFDRVSYWAETLRYVVLRSPYMLKTGNQSLQPNVKPTLLMRDLAAPLVEKLRIGSSIDGFNPERLRYEQEDFYNVPELLVDPDMMQMVFFNLLDNAIKYADPNDTFSVEIKPFLDGDDYCVEVWDNGVGIPKEMEGRLFELGARAPNASAYAEGTGIGLWLSRHLVELNGGRLDVRQWRKPTVLRISLPTRLATRK